MSLVKSRQRVADHGEVFTPAWLVDAMLDLVKVETERIDARILARLLERTAKRVAGYARFVQGSVSLARKSLKDPRRAARTPCRLDTVSHA